MTSLNQQWESANFGDPGETPLFWQTQHDLDVRALAGRPDLRAQRKRAALRMTTLIPAARARRVWAWRAWWPLSAVVAGVSVSLAVWIR